MIGSASVTSKPAAPEAGPSASPVGEFTAPLPTVVLRSGPVGAAGATGGDDAGDGVVGAVAVVLAAGADGPRFDDAIGQAVGDLGIRLDALIESESLRADAGSVLVVPLTVPPGESAEGTARPRRLLVVGVGAGRAADWRAVGAALARRSGSVARLALVAGSELTSDGLRSLAEGVALGAYRVAGLLDRAAARADPSAAVDDPPAAETDAGAALGSGSPNGAGETNGAGAAGGGGLREVVVLSAGLTDDPEAQEALRAARAVATSVWIARDLVNTPSLVKSPQWLAERAVRIAVAAGLTAHVLGPAELAEQGFGGLSAVGRGSPRPPYLVRVEYDGPAGVAAGGSPGADGVTPGHRVLVGKGITFDSGGLSLKPAVSMIPMKTDMAGAAAVLGAMTALPALGVQGRVTGLLCLAENMIGAQAMRPGDVISCWGGTTVEVLNTDAEGRLVIADGLAYAAGELGADVLVDLATLTGAISVALGRRTAGLFSSDDTLAAALSAAADTVGEQVWRLPLTDEYRPALDSTVADLTNMGRALDVGAGSIVAALFLREFVGGVPWAHLDIAGAARADADDGEISRGGTGWGVRTLLAWLTSPLVQPAPAQPAPAG
ncbi:leucyl aminopeptidase family protein [Candidatus Frankia nodulisporulans]